MEGSGSAEEDEDDIIELDAAAAATVAEDPNADDAAIDGMGANGGGSMTIL